MKITTVTTYWATIYVGLKNIELDLLYSMETVRKICSDYVNKVGLCVTLKSTEYIYSGEEGEYKGEPGAEIGLINYPRFPVEPEVINKHAMELAKILKVELEQHRVSVKFPDKTVMLGDV